MGNAPPWAPRGRCWNSWSTPHPRRRPADRRHSVAVSVPADDRHAPRDVPAVGRGPAHAVRPSPSAPAGTARRWPEPRSTDLRLLRGPSWAPWLRRPRSPYDPVRLRAPGFPVHPSGAARYGAHRWIEAEPGARPVVGATADVPYTRRKVPVRRYLAQLPQGRKAARVSELFRVRGDPFAFRKVVRAARTVGARP